MNGLGSRAALLRPSAALALVGVLAACTAGVPAVAPTSAPEQRATPAGPTPSVAPQDTPAATPPTTRTPAVSQAVSGRITLSDGECLFEPDSGQRLRAISLDVVNRTQELAGFDLFKVREGHSFADITEHIEKENSRAGDGLRPIGFPSSAESKTQRAVDAGASARLEAQADEGTWGVVCIAGAGPTPKAFYLVGPFEIASAAGSAQLGVKLMDDECALEASDAAISPGPVVVEVLNDTEAIAAIDMWRISNEGSYEELVGAIDEARQNAQAGGPVIMHPPYLEGLISSGAVPPGGSRTTSGTLASGIHAIVCLRFYEEAQDVRPYDLLGPIVVEEPA